MWYFYISLILSVLILGVLRRKYLAKELKIVFVVVLMALLCEIIRYVKPNPYLTHAYCFFELILLGLYYLEIVKEQKKLVLAGLSGGILIELFLLLTRENFLSQTSNIDNAIFNVIIVFWVIIYYFNLIKKPITHPITYDYNFWVNCGHLLFYSCTIIYFGARSYFGEYELYEKLSFINKTFNLSLYVFYLIAFWVTKQSVLISSGLNKEEANQTLN